MKKRMKSGIARLIAFALAVMIAVTNSSTMTVSAAGTDSENATILKWR